MKLMLHMVSASICGTHIDGPSALQPTHAREIPRLEYHTYLVRYLVQTFTTQRAAAWREDILNCYNSLFDLPSVAILDEQVARVLTDRSSKRLRLT